jgi:predicted acetyltransferase
VSTEIRHVAEDDILPWLKTMRTGLLADPGHLDDHVLEVWRKAWEPQRVWGAYDGGRCVGTLRTFGTAYSVPTGPDSTAEIGTDALTQVSVAATHRRQGVLRTMLSQSLADAKERGDTISLLRAAEWGIYGRFGYWPTSGVSDYLVRTAVPTTIRPTSQPMNVHQLSPQESLQPAMDVLARVRSHQHGHIARSEWMWERSLRLRQPSGTWEPVCVVARNALGEVDGFAMWTGAEGDWYNKPFSEPAATVNQLLATTPDAYLALWHYLINIDLVPVLKLEERAVDEPLEWLLGNGRAARRGWTGDGDWLRILDLCTALQSRRYAAEDRLVLEVRDDDVGGYATGRYLLDAGPGHAECLPSTLSPDLQLSQRALAGIYSGGNTVRSQHLAGLIDEETPGALNRLNLMFRTERAPWNATPF